MEFLGGEVGSNIFVKWDTFESKSFSVTLLGYGRRKRKPIKPEEFLNLKQIFLQSLPKKLFPKICFQVQQEIREDIVVGVIF